MRPTTLSISLLLSWHLICCAQDVAQDQADALTSSIQGPGHGEQNVLRTDPAQQDVVPDGTEDVTHAIKILGQIQPAKYSLVRHSRKSGIVGTALGYASTIFDLLFVHTPSQLDFTATASASKPAKLSHNLARAVRLLEQAAVKHDHPDALWLLGERHFHGNYTHPRDFPAAFQYYERLARLNGNASAQYMVGFMYATGIGGSVPRDQAKALLYHTFAADQGNTRSQMTVAYRHHAGIGTPRNCELAVKYYSQVAKKAVAFYKSGPPGGHDLTKNAYRIADETGGFYGEGASVVSAGPNARTAGPTSDAYAKIEDVLDYLDLKSRNGELTSTFNLAKLYYDGSRGLDRDLVQARALFVKILRLYWEPDGTPRTDPSSVAKKLAPRAAGFLGRMFLRGEATKVNYDNAMKWVKRGIEHGDVLSQYSMGVMYMYGLGVPLDPVKAASYLSAAADSNMAVAQTDLGVLFLDQGDIETARLYFELATASGHIEAYYYLAEIAEKGLGRERSCGIAASAYKVTSEIAEVVSASFIEANEAYDEGDTQKAVVAYMMAAEQGYENAQANVAWLLDQTHAQYGVQAVLSHILPFVKQSAISATDAALSLIYYTRSARQRNWDSLVKAGDYYISGLGIHNITSSEPLADSFTTDDTPPSSSPPALLHPNPENAAACYQAEPGLDARVRHRRGARLPPRKALLRPRPRHRQGSVPDRDIESVQAAPPLVVERRQPRRRPAHRPR